MNGGTLEIDSPRPYGPVAAGLLETLGIDVAALAKSTQHLQFYQQLGLQSGVFFDRETFGADRLVVGVGRVPYRELLARAPLSARAREQIAQIETATRRLPAGRLVRRQEAALVAHQLPSILCATWCAWSPRC
jgi:spermidine dehydrogenase